MQLTRLSHVCLNTADLQRTVQFYCEKLGCKVIHEYRNAHSEVYGVYLLVNNNTYLEFFKSDANSDAPSRFRHLCFEVSDIQEWAKAMGKQGFVVEPRRGRTDGVLQFNINDPDGNIIEFHEYDEHCVQHKYRS